jgi:phospholipase D1/2
MSGGDNPLAYGRYYGESDNTQGGERGLSDSARGLLSDGLKKFKGHYGQGQQQQGQQQQNYNYGAGTGPPQPSQSGSYDQQQPQQHQYQQQQYQDPNRPPRQDKLSGFLGKFQDTVSDVGSQLAQKIGTTLDADGYSQYGSSSNNNTNNAQRFKSFAPPRENNDVKWHVDGFSYFWAVSRALESAKESIWILDCVFHSVSI